MKDPKYIVVHAVVGAENACLSQILVTPPMPKADAERFRNWYYADGNVARKAIERQQELAFKGQQISQFVRMVREDDPSEPGAAQ